MHQIGRIRSLVLPRKNCLLWAPHKNVFWAALPVSRHALFPANEAPIRGRQTHASLSREHLRPSLPDRLWRFRSYPSSSSRPVVINARGSPERSPACCQAIFACSFPGVGHFPEHSTLEARRAAASGTGKRNSGKTCSNDLYKGPGRNEEMSIDTYRHAEEPRPGFLVKQISRPLGQRACLDETHGR
jgi:hypothetical protein